MTIVADVVDHAIGVDSHRDTHRAVVTAAAHGGQVAHRSFAANPAGYAALCQWGTSRGGRVVWAVEGTGSYGAGLTRHLLGADQWVVEAGHAARGVDPNKAKNDTLDAARAAKGVLAQPTDRLAAPRCGEQRDALAALVRSRDAAVATVRTAHNQLAAAIVCAPDPLRQRFVDLGRWAKIDLACSLRPDRYRNIHHTATARSLRSIARRARHQHDEAADLHRHITTSVTNWRPDLLDLFGVGPISAAVVLCAWSHPGRFRSPAAFANFAGAAPIEASSGQTRRHRLNRRGNRRLNTALHTIMLTRWQHCAQTATYRDRRRADGKTDRDIQRCLKTAIAGQLWKHLEHTP